MADKRTINLELVGNKYPLQCAAEDEPLYREAAALIKDEYQGLVNRFGNNAAVREEAIVAFTLLQLALKLKISDRDSANVSKRMESLKADLANFLNQHK